jgi:uncharacterized protein YndB with AHSA1/START domain
MSDPRDVVNVRVVLAPRDAIVDAYRDPEQLKLWWGPNGFTNTFQSFDFRPGGAWTHTMHGPDGTDYRNESEFVEMGPERIVVDHLRPMHRFRLTMSFDDLGDSTRVTWHMRFETAEECEKVRPWVEAGNEQNLDRLTAHLAEMAKRELRIARLLPAPRELVWKVWTDPNHVGNWWGPDGFTTTTYELDVRPGGVWRYDMHGPDGRDYPNRIQFLEVVAPERLIYIHGGDEKLLEPVHFRTTVLFADRGGSTHLSMRSLFPSEAELARVIREYKADVGAVQHLANLAKYLETVRS